MPADVQERGRQVNLPYVDIRGLTLALYCHAVAAPPSSWQRLWSSDLLELSQPSNVNCKATNQWLPEQISTRDRVLTESRSGLDRISIETAKTSHFAGILAICDLQPRRRSRTTHSARRAAWRSYRRSRSPARRLVVVSACRMLIFYQIILWIEPADAAPFYHNPLN
jgi:hypothetical protein